jgi:hypothetical protein
MIIDTDELISKIPLNRNIYWKGNSYTCVGFQIDLDGLVYLDLREVYTWEKRRLNIKFWEPLKEEID